MWELIGGMRAAVTHLPLAGALQKARQVPGEEGEDLRVWLGMLSCGANGEMRHFGGAHALFQYRRPGPAR